jgi:hypothetical protein
LSVDHFFFLNARLSSFVSFGLSALGSKPPERGISASELLEPEEGNASSPEDCFIQLGADSVFATFPPTPESSRRSENRDRLGATDICLKNIGFNKFSVIFGI